MRYHEFRLSNGSRKAETDSIHVEMDRADADELEEWLRERCHCKTVVFTLHGNIISTYEV